MTKDPFRVVAPGSALVATGVVEAFAGGNVVVVVGVVVGVVVVGVVVGVVVVGVVVVVIATLGPQTGLAKSKTLISRPQAS